jgi:hypothetical protein
MDRDLTFHSPGGDSGETDFWSFCIHGFYIYKYKYIYLYLYLYKVYLV